MLHLADRPVLFPGHDILGETTGPVVDTGIEFAGYHVYLGQRVIEELWRVVKPEMCPVAERDTALTEAKYLRERVDNLGVQVKAAEEAKDAHQRTVDALEERTAELQSLKLAYNALLSTTPSHDEFLAGLDMPEPTRRTKRKAAGAAR